MTREEIKQAIKQSCERVKQWPEWKQSILAYSSQPTRKTPREKVVNNQQQHAEFGPFR